MTSTAVTLAGIWSQILETDDLTESDNFFDIGGDSLRATKLVLHVRREWQIAFTMQMVLDGPGLSEMAARIDEVSGR